MKEIYIVIINNGNQMETIVTITPNLIKAQSAFLKTLEAFEMKEERRQMMKDFVAEVYKGDVTITFNRVTTIQLASHKVAIT
jgi:hypothetical protein